VKREEIENIEAPKRAASLPAILGKGSKAPEELIGTINPIPKRVAVKGIIRAETVKKNRDKTRAIKIKVSWIKQAARMIFNLLNFCPSLLLT